MVATVVALGLATELQITDALAAFAGLPLVKTNPLELALDVVTGALSAPFSRRHGLVAISKSATTLTIAVHDPLAPFPADDIRRVTGLEVQRVVATRSDIEAITKSFYDLRTSLQTAEKQLSARRIPSMDLGHADGLRRKGGAAHLRPGRPPEGHRSAWVRSGRSGDLPAVSRALRDAAIEKVLAGATTVSEMARVTGR